jgi:outer membrane protein assembly factor BamB
VDADQGKLLWDRELFQEDGRTAPKPHKKNSHASPTPVSDGQRVWVHFGHMGTACLTLNGDVLWKTQELSYNPVHGNGASPILFEDLLIVSCDGNEDPFVVALEQGTGKVRWKTLRKTGARLPFSFATCQIITVNGETQLISPAADYCLGYNPRTGEELWRVKYPQPGWSLICRPVYAHGLLYIGTGYINQHLIAFRPEGRGDLTKKIVWQTRRYAPNTPTPIVVGDELYMISDMGFLSCLDAKTGQLHYAERLAGKGYSASPIVSDGKLWITSEEGIGQVVALGREFKVLARNDLGERTFASFVPDNGKLFVRSDSHLYCFEAK